MTYCLGEAERKPTSAAAPDLAKPQVRYPFAPRARFERAPYCLGGMRVSAPCRPAKTQVRPERNRHKQSFAQPHSERDQQRATARLRSPGRAEEREVLPRERALTTARPSKRRKIKASGGYGQSMTVVRLVVGFAVFLALLWTPISLLSLGLDDLLMKRRIKDLERPNPDEIRSYKIIVSQFVPMSVVNVMAGALAGIGASLFVDSGRLRWPSSQTPIVLIGLAIFLTEFTGIAIAFSVTRPTRAWITDSSVFRSYLRQVNARRWVGDSELADIKRLQEMWSAKTNVRPLRDPDELRGLGLELPMAREEWASLVRYDPVQFRDRLRADVNTRQIRRWITRKRLWRLGIPPLVTGLALAGVIRGLIRLTGLSTWVSVLLFVPLAFGCVFLLYWLAFRIGGRDLVATNRYLALERKQLCDSDKLISQIEQSNGQEQANASPTDGVPDSSRFVIRIGRWELCHRPGARSTS
jgi:hypothetical protein